MISFLFLSVGFPCQQRALKYKVATSYDSKDYYQRHRGECLVERDKDSLISIDSNLDLNNEDVVGLHHQVSLNDADLSLTAIEEREIGFQVRHSPYSTTFDSPSVSLF